MSPRIPLDTLQEAGRLVTLFGVANDAFDRACVAEAAELRARATSGMRALIAEHPSLLELAPRLPVMLEAGLLTYTWPTVLKAIENAMVERTHGVSDDAPVVLARYEPTAAQGTAVTANKRTVEKYLDGFRRSDHRVILSCLTEDVEWVIPGAFHLVGKEAFDAEIENPAFVGSPTIETKRLVEEGDVVVAEGSVRASRVDGGILNAVFCDVFLMRAGLIRHLTSYLMELE
jgi:ketosteroid isomerase-like protein